MDMVDMAIMDIMERERLRLNQDITMDILITVDMDMAIMAREKLRQLLSPSLVIIIMDIPIMEVMVTMDIMARGKLRQMLLLSPVITIMVMEAMVIMDMDIMARGRQSQDTITMDIMVMDMAMVMVIMVKQATIYLFKNFSKLKRVSLNLVKRNTHLLKNSKFTLCNK